MGGRVTVHSSEFEVRNTPSPRPSPARGEGDSCIPHSAYSLILGIPHSAFLTALALSNDARLDPSGNIIGDPTEAALFSLARARGFEKAILEKEFPRVAELPFDSERKLMTTIHQIPSASVVQSLPSNAFIGGPSSLAAANYVSFTKGALDSLIDRADSVLTSDGLKPIDRNEVLAVHDRMAAEGLRVMGYCHADLGQRSSGVCSYG